jgi:predicted HNH restriction endonuclease
MPNDIAYNRKRKQKIKADFAEYKKTLSCSHCGLKDYRVLDFHHERDKEMGIHHMLSQAYAMERIMAEVKKCIPLCANCHRLVHWKD